MTNAPRKALLKALPKIELHIHLEGAIQPTTAHELAAKNDVPLPPHDRVEDLYSYGELGEFLKVYSALSAAIVTVDDFRRITYEMLESGAQNGVRYMEFFISPHAHATVPFARQFEGIRIGMKEAEVDFGIQSAIIPGINRELGPAKAQAYLDEILALRGDDVIGIGLDYYEAPFPPEPFAEVFARAKRKGLYLTAHAGEGGPSTFVAGSIDTLKVDRIDHGYNIVDDPALMARCRDMGIMFTCCPSTTAYTTPNKDLTALTHPIRRMKEAGLTISINSDDPPMFLTDLGREYEVAMRDMGFDAEDIRQSTYATIQHAFVDDSTKAAWRSDWGPEIDRICAQIAAV